MSSMKNLIEERANKKKLDSLAANKTAEDAANKTAAEAADKDADKAFAAQLKAHGPQAVIDPEKRNVTVFSTSDDACGYSTEVIRLATDQELPPLPDDHRPQPVVKPETTDVATEPAVQPPSAKPLPKGVPIAAHKAK
jgi:hypothetical protein